MTGDIGPAQKHFPVVLVMEAPEDLYDPARNGLREIAARELKARGPRLDGGLLSGWAGRLFRGRSLWEITFEIGMLGHHGRTSATPRRATSYGRCRAGLLDAAAYLHHVSQACRQPLVTQRWSGGWRADTDLGQAGAESMISRKKALKTTNSLIKIILYSDSEVGGN